VVRNRGYAVAAAVVLAAFGVGQIAFDLLRPHHDRLAEWSQSLGSELKRNIRPGDQVVALSTTERISMVEWYVNQSCGQVAWGKRPEPGPEVRRVWLVILATNRDGRAEVAEQIAALGPEWATIARAEYLVLADPRFPNYLHCTVVCMSRFNADVEHPLLQAKP
jgi:hypothetical protein